MCLSFCTSWLTQVWVLQLLLKNKAWNPTHPPHCNFSGFAKGVENAIDAGEQPSCSMRLGLYQCKRHRTEPYCQLWIFQQCLQVCDAGEGRLGREPPTSILTNALSHWPGCRLPKELIPWQQAHELLYLWGAWSRWELRPWTPVLWGAWWLAGQLLLQVTVFDGLTLGKQWSFSSQWCAEALPQGKLVWHSLFCAVPSHWPG